MRKVNNLIITNVLNKYYFLYKNKSYQKPEAWNLEANTSKTLKWMFFIIKLNIFWNNLSSLFNHLVNNQYSQMCQIPPPPSAIPYS